jgi:ABC-type transport system involved in multi-copper enzyme maturation permease subunit
MGKGKPFLEVLATSLNEDWRFPLLEFFAFLYVAATFAIAALAGGFFQSGASYAFTLVYLMSSSPSIVFIIIILKNLGFGLGGDLEKGVIQTIFSYPLKRRSILTAKLLSALGVAILIYLASQIFALWLLAPNVIAANLDVVFLTYAATLSPILLIAGIVLLLTLKVRRAGIALITGLFVYFGLNIGSTIIEFVSLATGSVMLFKIYSLIYPGTALQLHYSEGLGMFYSATWTPTFLEAILYVVGSYVVVATIFAVAYVYFDRKLGI